MRNNNAIVPVVILLFAVINASCSKEEDLSANGSNPVILAENLSFAEGPVYHEGDLFFSDIEADRIYRWKKSAGLEIFRESSGGANGLCFDKNDNLIVCEGKNKRVALISPANELSIVSDKFSDKPYNEPNDIWISPGGNIYFTDPVFTGTLSQEGQFVYCVLSSTGQVIRVADDLIKPNGITGNKEGSILYIADYGASKIYKYSIRTDGTIHEKQVFASIKADGLDTDSSGNLYAAGDGLTILNASGVIIDTIEVPGTATNSCIVEEGGKTIFITTHSTVFKYVIK